LGSSGAPERVLDFMGVEAFEERIEVDAGELPLEGCGKTP
jgi:hypothetical protein